MPEFQPKIYIKDESFDPIYKVVNKNFLIKTRIVPGLLLAMGFLILGTQVVYPLIYFKTQDETVKPVESSVLGIASGFSDFEFQELNAADPYRQSQKEGIPEFFYLTIPALKIDRAMVETNSTNLQPDKYLGHYLGSQLPGERGNTFIYGHSVLPWFYNPKNYKTIFSTLDQLNAGDIIEVEYGNKKLVYKVETYEVVATNNVNPLAEYKPKYLNESTITLMTCWPAGTRSKRLLLRAVLSEE